MLVPFILGQALYESAVRSRDASWPQVSFGFMLDKDVASKDEWYLYSASDRQKLKQNMADYPIIQG